MRRSALLFVLFLAACGGGPSEVVLVVDGELDTPTEIDALEVTVTEPASADAGLRTATATFGAGEPSFPRTLGIVQGDGPSGLYTVQVTARKGATAVVTQRARFEFVGGERRVLRVHLLRACQNVTCLGTTTCGENGTCQSSLVDLERWSGPIAAGGGS